MALSRRQKITIITLLFYWVAIFVLTHIPVPRQILRNIYASDKTLHFFAYFVLAFLLWFAINPNMKVSWRKATVWWILFVVVWYGVIDEWLQGYVGRNTDVRDFFADMAGAVCGLILLTFFRFWPAALTLTGGGIFFLTNFISVPDDRQLVLINSAFYFLGYMFFSMLWIRYMRSLIPAKAGEVRWLIGALALPAGFLLCTQLFSIVTGNEFSLLRVLVSIGGICMVVGIVFLGSLFHNKVRQKRAVRMREGPV